MAKRVFDFVCGALGLVILMPFFALIALAIKLDSPGPVFFRGERVGMGGKPFRIFKFRTMIADAARLGPGITAGNDPRVTRAGRFLRNYKIDELPQLFNVLRGEMSLVGPRPEDPAYVANYTPAQRQVLSVRPGVTSPASLQYRNEEQLLAGADWERQYVQTILPRKLQIESDYLEKSNFFSDIALIFRTLFVFFR